MDPTLFIVAFGAESCKSAQKLGSIYKWLVFTILTRGVSQGFGE